MGKKGVLLDCDQHVIQWVYANQYCVPMHFDRALGIVEDGKIVGAALFSSYNSVNAEFSYYGKGSLTHGIVHVLARIALYELRLARCTVIVPKRPGYLVKKLHKYGFRFEGAQRRQYGPTDSHRHTGCRFVVFKEDLERLAGEYLRKVA